MRVDGLALEADDPQHLTIALINFPTAEQQLLKDETLFDPVLNALKEIVYSGWPDNVKELPSDLRPYWSFRDELAVKAGVIFKGASSSYHHLCRRTFSRNCTVRGHQRVEQTRILASESFYWVEVNSDIENMQIVRKLLRATRREHTRTIVTTLCALQTVATHRNRHVPNPRPPLTANGGQILQVPAGRRNGSTYHKPYWG